MMKLSDKALGALLLILLNLIFVSTMVLSQEGGEPDYPIVDDSIPPMPEPEFIWSINWSPAGDKIAVAKGPIRCNLPTNDYAVVILDAVSKVTLARIGSYGMGCSVIHVAWSQDGSKILTGDIASGIGVWNWNGTPIAARHGAAMDSKTKNVGNPNGSLIATVDSRNPQLLLWNPNNQQVVSSLNANFPLSVAWSPDSTKVVTSNGDISIWNVSTGQVVSTFARGNAQLVRWSPDGSRLAVSRANNVLEVLNATTGATVASFSGHSGNISELRWSMDSSRIASSSLDGSVRVWNASNGSQLQSLVSAIPQNTFDWNPNSTQLAYGNADNTLLTTVSAQIPSNSGTGLRGAYFDNADFTAFKRFQIDSTVNIVPPGTTLPVVIPLSIRWVGRVEPLYSEAYTFFVNSSRRERLWVNGQLVLSDWSNPAGESSGTITLAAGVRYDVLLEYADEFGPNPQIKLEWQSARQARQIIPASQLYPPEGQMAFNGRTGSTGEIFVRNADGTGEINVSNHAADDNSPAWSPDGTRLAFVSTRTGNQDIWLVNADGTGLRQLTNNSAYDREIA